MFCIVPLKLVFILCIHDQILAEVIGNRMLMEYKTAWLSKKQLSQSVLVVCISLSEEEEEYVLPFFICACRQRLDVGLECCF